MIVLETEFYSQYSYGVVGDKEVTAVTVVMRNPITASLAMFLR
jgi:hypothetical protein